MQVLSKTEQVEQRVRRAITEGKYSHGTQLPTEKSLMKMFGVGRVTVRTAIDALEADGLLRRRRGSGTYVNYPAAKTEIGIVGNVLDMKVTGGDFQTMVLRELQHHIRETSFRPVLHFGCGATTEEYRKSLKLFESGMLYHTAGVIGLHDLRDFDADLQGKGIPAVGISLAIPTYRHCVILDYATMLDMALDVLRSHGIEEFAYVHWQFPDEYLKPRDQHTAIDRLYKKLAEKAEVTFVPVDYGDGTDPGHSYGALNRFLEKPDRPRCLFFADDGIFAAAFPAILEHGLQAPRDVQLFSHVNIGRSFGYPVPVSGIGFDPRRIAEELWRMLTKVMAAPGMPPSSVTIEPELVPGETLLNTVPRSQAAALETKGPCPAR